MRDMGFLKGHSEHYETSKGETDPIKLRAMTAKNEEKRKRQLG